MRDDIKILEENLSRLTAHCNQKHLHNILSCLYSSLDDEGYESALQTMIILLTPVDLKE